MTRKQKKPLRKEFSRQNIEHRIDPGYTGVTDSWSWKTAPSARKYLKYPTRRKRDWDNYLNYKKYYYFVKAAQSTGRRRFGYLLRAQKRLIDKPPPVYYMPAAHLSMERKLARVPTKYEPWQLY